MDKFNPQDHFDCSPQQYHHGLCLLWEALGITTIQDRTVYELCAEKIAALQTQLAEMRRVVERVKTFLIKLSKQKCYCSHTAYIDCNPCKAAAILPDLDRVGKEKI